MFSRSRCLYTRIPDWLFWSCSFALSSSIFMSFECSFWILLIHVVVDPCNSSVVNGSLLFIPCLIQLLLNQSNDAVILVVFRKLNFWISNNKPPFCITAANNTSLIIFALLLVSGEGSVVISSGHSSWFVNQHRSINQFSDKSFSKQPLLSISAGFSFWFNFWNSVAYELFIVSIWSNPV